VAHENGHTACERCGETIQRMTQELERNQTAMHLLMEKHMEAVRNRAEAEEALEGLQAENAALKTHNVALTETIAQLHARLQVSGAPPQQQEKQGRISQRMRSFREAIDVSAANAIARLQGKAKHTETHNKEGVGTSGTEGESQNLRISDLQESDWSGFHNQLMKADAIPLHHDCHGLDCHGLDYSRSPLGYEEADTEWYTEMVQAPDKNIVRAHLAHICRTADHPIGHAVSLFVSAFDKLHLTSFTAAAAKVRNFIAALHREVCTVFKLALASEEVAVASLAPLEVAVLSPLSLRLLSLSRGVRSCGSTLYGLFGCVAQCKCA